jgi:dipeptidyl-peptidase-4
MPNRYFLSIVFFSVLNTNAQKKELTTGQLLQGLPHQVTSPLPRFYSWEGQNIPVISKNGKLLQLNPQTGKETVYQQKEIKEDPNDTTAKVLMNDVYIYNASFKKQLTFSPNEAEENPTLSPDGKWLAYTRKGNLFSMNLSTMIETPLTTDGGKGILNGYASWVYYEEILGRSSNYRSFWWSPDSKRIAFMRMDERNVPVFMVVGEEGVHGRIEETRYPKAGDPNPDVRIGTVSAEGGAVVWSDFNEKEDQYFGMPYWKPDASALWVQWMPRSQDELRIYEIGLTKGEKKEIYIEKQPTWIELDDQGGRIYFLNNSSQFIYKSDSTGWAHLYLHDISGKRMNVITTGRFTVTEVLRVDEKKREVFFLCRKDNSACFDLYKVRLDGKGLKRLTFGNYNHQNIELSPDGTRFITEFSDAQTPTSMAYVNDQGKVIALIGDAKGQAFETTAFAKTEIRRIKSEDGKYDLPMRITWPLYYDSSRKYPVLINIYGGPNAGTVYDGWQFNLQQQWWAKEGLIQVALDHRASGHFGKEGMNYLHRNLGYWEMKDWTTMVKWLIANAGADSERICISGFSYGGYMSCYALTYGADLFTHGIAGGSVTDWKLYDSHYTERYMDTPEENPEGYKNSSVLTHVHKYKGLLKIYHGTMDDNVHLQNSLQLVKALQEKKAHFEFMPYPGGRHGWRNLPLQDAHSRNENAAYIYQHLLKKEMPGAMFK